MNIYEALQESIEGENVIDFNQIEVEDDDQLIEDMFTNLDFVDDIEKELYSENFEDIMDILKTKASEITEDIYTLEDALNGNAGLDNFLNSEMEIDEIGPSMEFQTELLNLERMFVISERILEDEDLAEEYAETLALEEEEDELTTEDYTAFIDENTEELIISYEEVPFYKQVNSRRRHVKNLESIVKRRELEVNKIDSRIKNLKKQLSLASGDNIKSKLSDRIRHAEITRKSAANGLSKAKSTLSTSKAKLDKMIKDPRFKKSITDARSKVEADRLKNRTFGQKTKEWIGGKFKKTGDRIKGGIKKSGQKASDFIHKKTGIRVGKGAPDPNKGLKKLPSGFFARIIVRIRILLRRIKRAFGKFSSGLSETKIMQWLKGKSGNSVTTKNVGIGAAIIGFLTGLFVILRRSKKWDVDYNQQVSKLSGINSFNGDKKAKIISKRELDSAITGCKNILKNASEATKAMTSGELDIRSKFDQSDFAAVGITMTGSGGTKISKKSRSRQSLSEHGYTDGDLQKYKRDHSEIHNLYMKWSQNFAGALPNGGSSSYKLIANSTRDAYLATMTNLYATLIKFG